MDKKETKIKTPINKKANKCFQYVATVRLNYEEIKKDTERTTKIEAFINKCNWEGINSEKDDWKKFEKNNVNIVLNVLYAKAKNIASFCFKI